MPVCIKCREEKPQETFSRRGDGYRHVCKKCHTAQKRRWEENLYSHAVPTRSVSDENKFYVYEHWRPDRDECCYVGKGYGSRANILKKRNRHHMAIQAKLGRQGMGVEVRFVAMGIDEAAALKIEIKQIARWRDAGVDLVNITSGGDGVTGLKWSDESRKRLGETQRGRKQSPETIAKRSAAMRGRIVSEETCRRISDAKKGKPISEEHRAALIANHWRKKKRDATCIS